MWRKVGCVGLIVVVVAVIAAIIYQQTSGEGGISFGAGRTAKDKDKDEKPIFEAARLDDLRIIVEATGSTEAITDIEVKSEATGRITEFYVEEGDTVQQGDLICRLDQSNQLLVVEAMEIRLQQARLAYDEARQATSVTAASAYQSAVDSAEANLSSAAEALENARTSFERIEEVHGKGYATDQELDTARQVLAAAQAAFDSADSAYRNAATQLESFQSSSDRNAIEQARLLHEASKVSLAEARKQLGDSVISSPIDGIILEKQLDVGDSVVSINSAYGGGNTIVKVADLTKVQVRTTVDEIDIGKIAVGQSAAVTVDTYYEREFAGMITNVFPQGVNTGTGLIGFIAMVEVDNSEGLLLGNMTAAVKIEAEVIEDSLLIPLAATRAGEEPDTTIVYVMDDEQDPFDEKATHEEREVKLGDTDYLEVVVLEGLEEGEYVKVRGFETRIRFD